MFHQIFTIIKWSFTNYYSFYHFKISNRKKCFFKKITKVTLVRVVTQLCWSQVAQVKVTTGSGGMPT